MEKSMGVKLRKKSKKERFQGRRAERVAEKDKLHHKLIRQEDRVAKTMAKRDIRRIKKGKDVSTDTTEKRVRDAGPLAFKKKKLVKLRAKNEQRAREEGYKQYWDGMTRRAKNRASHLEWDESWKSMKRLEKKHLKYKGKS